MASGGLVPPSDAQKIGLRLGSIQAKYDVKGVIGQGSYGQAVAAVRKEDGEQVGAWCTRLQHRASPIIGWPSWVGRHGAFVRLEPPPTPTPSAPARSCC